LARVAQLPIRSLLAYAVAGALLTIAWARLDAGNLPLDDVALVLAFGLAPTLAVALGLRRLAVAGTLAVATVIALGVAFGTSPLEARPGGGHDFFGPVLGSIRGGLQDFYESTLPFDAVDYPQMRGLVVVAIFAFTVAVGIFAALRRTTAAALVLLVGLGWAATLVPGDRPLVTGALTLGGMLLYLALARVEIGSWRSLVPAVAAGVLLVLAAVGASTSQAVAKGAFLSWESWDLYDPPEDPVSVSYVWAAQYGGLTWPKQTTTVLRVKQEGARRQLYWRATTLDEYNGSHWLETQEIGDFQPAQELLDVSDDRLLPAAAADSDRWIKQEMEVEALRDHHLIGASQPVRWEPGTSLDFQRGPSGSVLLDGNLRQGQRYTVWSYAPRPSPVQLERANAEYPSELGARYLEPLQGFPVPAFGEPGRDEYMRRVFSQASDSFIAEHGRLYELSRRLTDLADTPYAAALVLETWFRNPAAGGFVYDQQPPRPPIGEAPLVAFVDPGDDNPDARRGYCQHFAGAMTLMLRLLGIPSRIAAGFTSGKYDTGDRVWSVVDRNAHTWVEVYFPGYGWLPFDPTPGRGTLDAPYSFAFTSGTTLGEKTPPLQDILGRIGAAALSRTGLTAGSLPSDPRTNREDPNASRPAGAGEAIPGGDGAGAGGGRAIDTSLIALLALVAAGTAAAIVLAKTIVRRIRFASNEPRRVAAACRRDLVAFLRDQGADPSPSATVAELGEFLESEFAVDAAPYVRTLSAARFGPLSEASQAARSARRELGRLRREMWRQLTWARRIKTALNLRSFAG
jgi:transglutaminase-like putative cysteine protease